MPYITTRLLPVYRQLTFEEIISGEIDISKPVYSNETNTKTIWVEHVDSERVERDFPLVSNMIDALKKFNEFYKELFEADRQSLYHSFKIPKRTGGLRQIDAPNPELMNALRVLKGILESSGLNPGYHTSAFAYVEGRSTVDAAKRHQRNQSWWFLKTDFSNFFGSTTLEFVQRSLSDIYPYSEVMKNSYGREMLLKALDLCFLNGGLPQGTPISPMLTNLIMIPIDHKISSALHNDPKHKFVYTRYADDIFISSRTTFDYEAIIEKMRSILKVCGAPYVIKPEKTRYGSKNGSNWMLGLMLNKDNNITVGGKRKRMLRMSLSNYAKDKKKGVDWSIEDVYSMRGQISYQNMVEPDYTEKMIGNINEKHKVDIMKLIEADLSAS